jgi:hypothetical protein
MPDYEQRPEDAILRRIQSKYAQFPTGSGDFATSKQGEIDLEERPRLDKDGNEI